jgi:hypothetical protein
LGQNWSFRRNHLTPVNLPSLTMATSAMDPNHGAVAPHASCSGARVSSLFSPLSLGAKSAPIKKLRDGRGFDLRWRPFCQ